MRKVFIDITQEDVRAYMNNEIPDPDPQQLLSFGRIHYYCRQTCPALNCNGCYITAGMYRLNFIKELIESKTARYSDSTKIIIGRPLAKDIRFANSLRAKRYACYIQ